MADGVDLDLSALGAMPGPANDYVSGFNLGRQLAGAPPARVAPRPAATDAVGALGAQLDALPGPQRAAALAQAQENNEALAHVLMGLRGYPPEQRLEIAQHVARQTGLLDANTVTADDVSDQGIQAHLASAMSVEQFLKQQRRRAGDPTEEGAPSQFTVPTAAPTPAGIDFPVLYPTGAGHLTDTQLRTFLGL